MNTLKKLSLSSLLLVILTIPAFAGVVVNNPANGATVSSPFGVSATAATCSSQSVVAMGYSLDSGSDATIVGGSSMNANAQAGSGGHTVHIKAWGQSGAVCVSDVSVNVSVSATAAVIPANSATVSAIQTIGSWQHLHDGATGGWSSGAMVTVNSPSLSGSAREFYTTYGNSGGERYHVAFNDDVAASNFVYDAWVYLTDSAANIGNLEMDLNQVMPNGQTVIYGMQCDGYTLTWDYNANWTGPYHPTNQWMHSSAPCNIRSWGRNQWHHFQLSYSRTDWGVVTYHSVTVDGKVQPINATAPSAYALGWAPVLLTNFQVDGLGSAGSVTLFLDNLTIDRW
jgi:hypothetical protein